MSEPSYDPAIEALEIELLLEGLRRRYGHDFRDYAPASLRRRIWNIVRSEELTTITALLDRLLHDPAALDRFLTTLTVNVSAMFRDPPFYRALRRDVVPLLRTYPSFQVWHAGCSTGEEVYSLAILLQEEGLYSRSRIYATDLNEGVLQQAAAGIFPLGLMKGYTNNYIEAGGKRSFSDYYTAGYGSAIFSPALRENVVFAQHNLITDGPFQEFQVILCRNVMIYFNRTLQTKVHNLLYSSLVRLGVLGLGSKETLVGTPHFTDYEPLGADEKLYRKVR